jgi:two-component system response regulator NreC
VPREMFAICGNFSAFPRTHTALCPLGSHRADAYCLHMFPVLRLAPVPDSPESDSDRAASPSMPITILLADDHAAMRASLRLLLEGEADIDVIAETDSLDLVLGHVRERRPDVLVLDLGMSSWGSGVETLVRMSKATLDTSIVVLTMNDDPACARRALDNGAIGLVLKEMADSDLPAAVRNASRGKRYVSPLLATKLNGGQRSSETDKLTPREREVLRLIALGHTSVEIADKLGLSPRTIETHRARIHRKLGLATRAELVRYALQQQLLRV